MFLVHTGCETADVDTGRHVIEQQFAGKRYEFVIEIQVQIAWFLYINIKQALCNDFNVKLHTEKMHIKYWEEFSYVVNQICEVI